MNQNKRKPISNKAKSTKSTEYVVSEPMGLLEFLRVSLPNQARNKVKAHLTHREVSVDGVVTTKYDYLLKKGQVVKIDRSGKPQQASASDFLEIIYEDNDFIVINKPAGLLSIATDTEKVATAYHLLTEYVKQKDAENRIFVVHRLDRDTSGVLMVAKNEEIKYALQDHWDELVIFRGYIALVEGQLEEKEGQITSWLKETKTHFVYSSDKNGDGQKAVTNYKVLQESANLSMLEVKLETGRKNQIRVHMQDLGHPIIGDKKYGSHVNPIRRLGLHAHKLEFIHPITKQKVSFLAPIPRKFKAILKQS
ncbi:RluA family pseudouridine synthase [Paludicola sp. MB14-C6]|uniref:RluA family pseudouridine synthase n=1 Tax=Paludihabitans sp. MB14-C6 TaxID=3070656 RepID=UPI0027DB212E|nr:RluA family pseudouridine synthase [Paludicola sp. MB14-C6]WMJ21922.1 RluA family pseudouridine synthase [Paludicola sp. MB14-C6]